MQRKSMYTAALVTFLLLGAISLAMEETSDQSNNTSTPIENITVPPTGYIPPTPGVFEATVNNLVSMDRSALNQSIRSMVDLTLIYENGSTAFTQVQITPGSEEANMYTTLNSAYLEQKHVRIAINYNTNGQPMINTVSYWHSMGNNTGNLSIPTDNYST